MVFSFEKYQLFDMTMKLNKHLKSLLESYKTNFSINYNNILSFRANPYNFVNHISSLITGEDPNS